MKLFMMTLLTFLTSGQAIAHEWTPTYPELFQSYVQGVLQSELTLYNARQDVEYYEIGVFDKDMEPVSFAVSQRIINVEYQKRKKVSVFVRAKDRDRAVYVCSKSKLLKDSGTKALITSNICSKYKR
jgi:hypothetical protein